MTTSRQKDEMESAPAGELENAVEEISESFDAKLARYSRIQTFANVITGAFTIVTATFLVYIAWMQYQLMERQSAVEEASVEPRFSVQARYFEGDTLAPPETLLISNNFGNAHIQEIKAEVFGNVAMTASTGRVTCDVIITNYFASQDGDRLNASNLAQTMVQMSIGDEKGTPSFHHMFTVLSIRYTDAFNDEKTARFISSIGRDVLMYAVDDGSEAIGADVIISNERDRSVPILLEAPVGPKSAFNIDADIRSGSRKSLDVKCPGFRDVLYEYAHGRPPPK